MTIELSSKSNCAEPPTVGADESTLVEAVENTGRFLGRGFYNPNSEIAIRLHTT